MATKPSALAAATTSANRHLRGETNEVDVKVDSNVIVSVGDLMIIEAVSGSAQQGDAGYMGAPASWASDGGHAAFGLSFVGVAMTGSKSGVTENIPVATTGIFRFPVTASAGQTVTAGYIVSGATYGASGVSVLSQKVVAGPAAGFTSAAPRIGMIVRGQNTSSTVDFLLMTRFSGVSKMSWPT